MLRKFKNTLLLVVARFTQVLIYGIELQIAFLFLPPGGSPYQSDAQP